VNGTFTDNFAWIDAKSGLVQGMRTQINNLILDVEILDSLVYLGGDFFTAEGTYSPNLATYRVDGPVFQTQAVALNPKLGGNTGDVTIQIFGSGLTTHPQVILRKAGVSDIVAIDSLTRVFFGDQVRATFDLRNAPLGLRDVWLIAGGDTVIMTDGFRVVKGQAPRVWAKVVRPPRIRFNPESPGHTLLITYGNAGTIDAEGVPIWLALSSHINLADINLQFLPYPSNLTPGDVLDFVPVDTLNGRPVDVVVYAMVIGRVPAGFQGQIAFRIRPDTVGNFFVAAWATQPLYGSPLKYAVGECTDRLIGKIVGLVPGGDCVYNAMDALLSPIFDAALDPDFGSAQYAANYAWTLGGAIVDCGIAATGGGLVLDILKDILNYKALFDDIQTIASCLELFGPNPKEDEIQITVSCDPNQKAGLPGVGAPQWINPVEPLPYLVEFENLADATAPAIEVVIEDTLDTQVMNLRTFELRFFTLADSLFEIPPGRQEWKQMVDLRPTGNQAFARVSFELDTLSGVFTSRFEGLDPATLEPLDGALEGIIPPNVNDPEGRGSIGYRVDLIEGLPTGTPVANSAAIYFDFNAPIVTNTWLNTLDVDAPESAVSPLDSVQFSLEFPVSWSGSDLGSGVETYDLYVSTDGGGYVREIPNLSDTVITFTGEAGREYAFYTIATDSVGNEEMAPLVADATTRIDEATAVEDLNTATLAIVPNPNRGAFGLQVDGLPAGTATLRIFDATGRQVTQQAVPLAGSAQEIPIQLNLPAGMYLLGLQTGGRYWHQRLVIE
ncbi:MAG: T9SS C-terminal target domain-containing protein, partial [Bacteroidetes bacterium]